MPPAELRTRVAEALDAAVAEVGADFVYPRTGTWRRNGLCVYAREVEGVLRPACLVGQVLVRLGVSLEELEAAGSQGFDMDEAGYLFPEAVNDEDLVTALSVAQDYQDEGQSWGVAQTRFHELLAGKD